MDISPPLGETFGCPGEDTLSFMLHQRTEALLQRPPQKIIQSAAEGNIFAAELDRNKGNRRRADYRLDEDAEVQSKLENSMGSCETGLATCTTSLSPKKYNLRPRSFTARRSADSTTRSADSATKSVDSAIRSADSATRSANSSTRSADSAIGSAVVTVPIESRGYYNPTRDTAGLYGLVSHDTADLYSTAEADVCEDSGGGKPTVTAQYIHNIPDQPVTNHPVPNLQSNIQPCYTGGPDLVDLIPSFLNLPISGPQSVKLGEGVDFSSSLVQGPDTCSSLIQGPDTGSSLVQGPDTCSSLVQDPDRGSNLVQGPDAGSSLVQGPYTCSSIVQGPDAGSNLVQVPDAGSNLVQGPDAGSYQVQGPDAGSYQVQVPDSDSNLVQGPDAGSYQVQVPDAGSSPFQGPDTCSSQVQGPDTCSTLVQGPDRVSNLVQGPDTGSGPAQGTDADAIGIPPCPSRSKSICVDSSQYACIDSSLSACVDSNRSAACIDSRRNQGSADGRTREEAFPITPESKRRLRPHNRLLEKLGMLADPLVDSIHSQGRNSLCDSQYSAADLASLAVSVTLSSDMESSGFFSDFDGRLSTADTLACLMDDIPEDSRTQSGLSIAATLHNDRVHVDPVIADPMIDDPDIHNALNEKKQAAQYGEGRVQNPSLHPQTTLSTTRRVKKPGRWDAIMNGIDAGRHIGQARARTSLDLDFKRVPTLPQNHRDHSIMSRDHSITSRDHSIMSRDLSIMSRDHSIMSCPNSTINSSGSSPRSEKSSILGEYPRQKPGRRNNQENIQRSSARRDDKNSPCTDQDLLRPKSSSFSIVSSLTRPSSAPRVTSTIVTRSKSFKTTLSNNNISSKNTQSQAPRDLALRQRTSPNDLSLRQRTSPNDLSLRQRTSPRDKVLRRRSPPEVIGSGKHEEEGVGVLQERLDRRTSSNASTVSRASVGSGQLSFGSGQLSVGSGQRSSVHSNQSKNVVPVQRKTPLVRSTADIKSTTTAVPGSKPVSKPVNSITTTAVSKAKLADKVVADKVVADKVVADKNRRNLKATKTTKGLDGRGLGEQPDLLKETVRTEAKTTGNLSQTSLKDAKWNVVAFNSLAVVATYYVNRTEICEKRLEHVVNKLRGSQEEHARSLKVLDARLRQEQEEERTNLTHSLNQLQEQYNGEKERRDLQEKERQEEEERGREEQLRNLLQSREELQLRLANQECEASQFATSLREKAEQEKAQLIKQKADLEDQLSHLAAAADARLADQLTEKTTELELRLRAQWEEERTSLEKRLRDELSGEKKVSTSKKVDYRLEAERERAGRLEQEVESLRTVLEMRTEDLHVSRLSRIKLEEKLLDYEQKEEAWRKANAQVEDLKEQLAARFDVERRLLAENRSLSSLMEREQHEKKRLSMENEQLSWKIRQEFDSSMSYSFCEGTDHSLPIIGVNNSSRFSFGGRPVSAPPGKLLLGQPLLAPGDDGLPPDSPRVLELVEKMESVAWKLEYDPQQSSPRGSRKISPQSPHSLRKCKSSLMTRSLDRTNLLTRSSSSPNTLTSSPVLSRSTSIRRKVSPQFETLNEFTDESDESRKTSPEEKPRKGGQPHPVDIGLFEDDLCEISSSSEIEVGGDPDSLNTDTTESDQDLFNPDDGGRDNLLPPAKGGILQQLQVDRSSPSSELHSPVTERTLRSELSPGICAKEDDNSDTDLSETADCAGVINSAGSTVN